MSLVWVLADADTDARQADHPPATTCDTDAVFFTVFGAGAGASVNVTIGGVGSTVNAPGGGASIWHGSVPLGGRTGGVVVKATGVGGGATLTVQAKNIEGGCVVGWNA